MIAAVAFSPIILWSDAHSPAVVTLRNLAYYVCPLIAFAWHVFGSAISYKAYYWNTAMPPTST